MWPRLMTHQGVNAPATFEPEPTSDRTNNFEDTQYVGEGHAFISGHDAIMGNDRSAADPDTFEANSPHGVTAGFRLDEGPVAQWR